MSLNNEILEVNWTSIEEAANFRTQEQRKCAKEIYFNKQTGPIFGGGDILSENQRLILSCKIDDVTLQELSDNKVVIDGATTEDRRACTLSRDVLALSSNKRFTFGCNTFYTGKEGAILDALGYDDSNRLDSIKNKVNGGIQWERKKHCCDLLAPYGLFAKYLFQSTPAESDCSWRSVNLWGASVKGIPRNVPVLENRLTNYEIFLAAEWACRNSKYIDSNVHNLAMKLQDVMTGSDTTEQIRSCLLYTSPSPRDATLSRMPSSA